MISYAMPSFVGKLKKSIFLKWIVTADHLQRVFSSSFCSKMYNCLDFQDNRVRPGEPNRDRAKTERRGYAGIQKCTVGSATHIPAIHYLRISCIIILLGHQRTTREAPYTPSTFHLPSHCGPGRPKDHLAVGRAVGHRPRNPLPTP